MYLRDYVATAEEPFEWLKFPKAKLILGGSEMLGLIVGDVWEDVHPAEIVTGDVRLKCTLHSIPDKKGAYKIETNQTSFALPTLDVDKLNWSKQSKPEKISSGLFPWTIVSRSYQGNFGIQEWGKSLIHSNRIVAFDTAKEMAIPLTNHVDNGTAVRILSLLSDLEHSSNYKHEDLLNFLSEGKSIRKYFQILLSTV